MPEPTGDEATGEATEQASPVDPVIPAESPTWAESGDLNADQPWRDVTLPVRGTMVRVRFLGNNEGITLGFLPEFQAFGKLMAEEMVRGVTESDDPDPDREERAKQLEIERTRYSVFLAHVVINDHTKPFEMMKCPDCLLEHPPALWTRAQVDLLHPRDIAFVGSIAEREDELATRVPFSEAGLLSDTPPPADTGE